MKFSQTPKHKTTKKHLSYPEIPHLLPSDQKNQNQKNFAHTNILHKGKRVQRIHSETPKNISYNDKEIQ